MSDESTQISEYGIAQQTQEKFEFYLLSLVFTLLALSVQTAKFGGSIAADALELGGWLFLIISGFTGLSRMEWVPVIRTTKAQQSGFEEEIRKLKTLQLQGQTELIVLENSTKQPITERIENRQEAIGLLCSYLKKLERKHDVKYGLHIYGFVFGVLFVAVSRAFNPAIAILKAWGY